MKILLVEDDKFLRKVLEKKLINKGFEVISAVDGDEAFEKVVLDKPDIVLLDIILPKKSGFIFLENFRKDPNFKEIPVLILSNLGQEEDIKKAFELGANDYFVKARMSLEDVINKVVEYNIKLQTKS